ncbi:MAG: alpha/beta hydrolase [Saprospiraceae bacterium]|nr:alpha/beta hydrolase [Saprospiraceae bacterium]MDW8484051.1 alpha/beta hydrolase [Saprospiraceae bacterium]
MLSLFQPVSRYLEQKALFRPRSLPDNYRFAFGDASFEEFFLNTPDGTRLNVLYFPTPCTQRRGTLLYFHGNRGNLQRWGFIHIDFTRRGYDFVIPDYRGYGKSTGTPSEHALYEDARLVYEWTSQRHRGGQLVIYGRSLGSAPACYLAAHVSAHRLLLETPFDSFAGLLAAHLGRYQASFRSTILLPNDRYLCRCLIPVLILHGTHDRIVPLSSAGRLRACLKDRDEFVLITGGTHHNLRTFELYQQALDRWLGPPVTCAEGPSN